MTIFDGDQQLFHTDSNNNDDDDDPNDGQETDIDLLFEEHDPDDGSNVTDDIDNDNVEPPSSQELDPAEQLWRYVKKPLLRIGAKGATHSHGNSLRQLLEDHTVVKVKINTRKYNNSLQEAALVLQQFAVDNGAPDDIELIQLRESDKTVLFGLPGTIQQCQDGIFPPTQAPASSKET